MELPVHILLLKINPACGHTQNTNLPRTKVFPTTIANPLPSLFDGSMEPTLWCQKDADTLRKVKRRKVCHFRTPNHKLRRGTRGASTLARSWPAEWIENRNGHSYCEWRICKWKLDNWFSITRLENLAQTLVLVAGGRLRVYALSVCNNVFPSAGTNPTPMIRDPDLFAILGSRRMIRIFFVKDPDPSKIQIAVKILIFM